MKFTSTVLLAAGVASAHVLRQEEGPSRATCRADNCARQVSVTRFNSGGVSATQVARSEDCSTFLATTVTSTVGGTATTVFPSAIPTYASSCTVGGTSAFARYSSACANCVGVTGSATTVLVGCNRDLCSRGLFGTRVAASDRAANTAACSSFLLFSVSADVTIRPTDVPANAQASCTALDETRVPSARFSSACVCAGITPVTSYAGAGTTITVTLTPTEITTAPVVETTTSISD